MIPTGCGNRRDFWPNEHSNGKFVSGGFYAPYVLNRYTKAAIGPGRRSMIYWVVSSWNPYEVSVSCAVFPENFRWCVDHGPHGAGVYTAGHWEDVLLAHADDATTGFKLTTGQSSATLH